MELSSQWQIDGYQKLNIGHGYHMLNDEPIKFKNVGKNNSELRGFYELVIKNYLAEKTDVIGMNNTPSQVILCT